MAKPERATSSDGPVGDLVALAHRDGLVALGVEALADGADAPHAVAGEDRLHLLQDGAQALGARPSRASAQRPLDAVDHLEPVARELVAALDDARRSISRAVRLR